MATEKSAAAEPVGFTSDELKMLISAMGQMRGSISRSITKGGDDEIVHYYKKRDQAALTLVNKLSSMELFK